MAKRFCDPKRWEDSWYRKLIPHHKNFWDFLYCQCDNAGVWKPDLDLAAVFIGCPIEPNILDIINNGKERIKVLSNGYWWVIDYVSFQFGKEIINPKVRKHVSDLVSKYVEFGYSYDTQSIPNTLSMHTPKDKDKDKDKEKDKDKANNKGGLVRNNPPTLEMIKDYCQERKNGIDPQAFFDSNTAVGWIDKNKNPYKDWKAVVRKWESYRKITAPKRDSNIKRPIAIVVIEKIAAGMEDREILQDLVGIYSEYSIIEAIGHAKGCIK